MQKGTLSTVIHTTNYLVIASIIAAASVSRAPQANANQAIEWTETLNIPKGTGMPSGVTADILGIEIGDTYSKAKAKLQAIIAALPSGDEGRLKEEQRFFRVPIATGTFLETKYPSKIIVEISRRSPRQSDTITVLLSAPSSGAQVIGLDRLIQRYDHKDQIRIKDYLAAISEKFAAIPTVTMSSNKAIYYRYHYDNGQAVTAPENASMTCPVSYWMGLGNLERDLSKINTGGSCDIILDVQFNLGISKDHAAAVWFKLLDADRAKANQQADYQFIRDYLGRLQQQTSGAAPKL